MNIGVVVDNELNNDPRVLNECKIFTKEGLNVVVLCFDMGNYQDKVIEEINIERIPISRKLKNYLFAFNNTFGIYTFFWKRKIKRFIKRYEIDALHVHDLYMSKAAGKALKNHDIPITLDLHENYPAAVKGYQWMYKFPFRLFIQPDTWEKLEKKYLKIPDNIIVLSNSYKNDLIEKYPFLKEKNIITYPNVPNIEQFRKYRIQKDVLPNKNWFVLLYFGGIAKRRGIYTLLESIDYIKKEIPNVLLLLIGPVDKSEKSYFSKMISSPGIKDNVIHMPWKDIAELPSYIKASNICLSPILKNAQHESGVANKVFQYMLFERPLVVSNCKPQVEIIEKEECGVVFESGNVLDLTEKVIYLYNHPEIGKQMGKNGRFAVENKYNTRVAGKELVKVFNTGK
jgi:glycosyltransferase involved in cell wall biosynthesis